MGVNPGGGLGGRDPPDFGQGVVDNVPSNFISPCAHWPAL